MRLKNGEVCFGWPFRDALIQRASEGVICEPQLG